MSFTNALIIFICSFLLLLIFGSLQYLLLKENKFMKETLVEWLESTNEYHKKPNSVLLYLHMNKAQDNLYNMLHILKDSKINEMYPNIFDIIQNIENQNNLFNRIKIDNEKEKLTQDIIEAVYFWWLKEKDILTLHSKYSSEERRLKDLASKLFEKESL